MDDITEVSSTASIERKNTFMITKSTEARSKTVFSTIIGGVIGLLICLICSPLDHRHHIRRGGVHPHRLGRRTHSSWSAKSKTGPTGPMERTPQELQSRNIAERFSTPIRISQSI